MSNSRLSNFELLRIFAMYFIVVHHFCVHGIILSGWNENITNLEHFNNFFLQFFNLGGKIGVNIFLLLSGYFLINGNLKIEKFVNLYLKTFLYGILVIFLYDCIELKFFANIRFESFDPINISNYWFVATYLIMYMFLPFLNKLFNNLDKIKYFAYIILSVALWSFFALNLVNQIIWFITVYSIGAFIKRFDPTILSLKNCLITLFVTYGLLSIWILNSLKNNPIDIKLLDMNNLLILVLSIAIFGIFKHLKIKHSNFINYISASMISVYLIHDNASVRNYFWSKIVPAMHYITSPKFILYIIIIPTLVFSACIAIDKIFERIYKPLLEFLTDKIIYLIIYLKNKTYKILSDKI